MSGDGIALLRLGPLDDPEALHPNLQRLDDESYLLATFVPFSKLAGNPPKVLLWLDHQLGPVLRLHNEARGVFVFEEQSFEAETYADLVKELAEAGFWATAPLPEIDEEEAIPTSLKAMAASAMAAITGSKSPVGDAGAAPLAVPAPVPAEPGSEKAQVGDRYEDLAVELERAAAHLRRTAELFRDGDVPRASAHRVAAEGHLVGVRIELDGLAVLHASRSKV